jgi:hypothetical protein
VPHVLTSSSNSVADFSKVVTVILNEEEPELTARFTIAESLLTESSEYSKAARRNHWKKASSRVVRIPDVDVGTFNSYLQWACRREITVQHELKKGYTSAQGAHGALEDLVKLWLLADRFADTQLRNLVIDTLHRVLNAIVPDEDDWIKGITLEMTVLIWTATTAGRALRRLVLDYYAWAADTSSLKAVKDKCHPDFLIDLLMKVMCVKEGDGDGSWETYVRDNACYYHEHEGWSTRDVMSGSECSVIY